MKTSELQNLVTRMFQRVHSNILISIKEWTLIYFWLKIMLRFFLYYIIWLYLVKHRFALISNVMNFTTLCISWEVSSVISIKLINLLDPGLSDKITKPFENRKNTFPKNLIYWIPWFYCFIYILSEACSELHSTLLMNY